MLSLEPEQFPLKGVKLWRWKLAIKFYRLGCRVSGRHDYLFEWDKDWKVWYCPHCGETKGDEGNEHGTAWQAPS